MLYLTSIEMCFLGIRPHMTVRMNISLLDIIFNCGGGDGGGGRGVGGDGGGAGCGGRGAGGGIPGL